MLGWLNEHSTEFFLTKGCIALVAVILYMWHMQEAWTRIKCRGQRFRYYTLLAYAVLVATASAEQASENVRVLWSHVASVWVTLLLVASAVVSIRHDHTPGDPCGYQSRSS